MNLLYNLSITFYGLAIRIAALFNRKARAWREGRTGQWEKLLPAKEEKEGTWTGTAWFHCASLGEFEQGRPVIEKFRERYPHCRILLTFFSPSGYEIRKNYAGADQVLYLPLDTVRNAKRFVGQVKPDIVFFVKYEYWFNFLRILHDRNIPVIMISAIFRPGHHFFKPYGNWFRGQLRNITWFFLQNGESKSLLEQAGIRNFTVTGDTRFDRVTEITRSVRELPAVERFAAGATVFVAGSTWPADEEIILPLMRSRKFPMKFILVPHEVDPARIESLVAFIHHPVVRLSELTLRNAARTKVLVVDSMGLLSQLYRFATIAYIGGGFGVGIHNILEAAAYGKPVIFGPNYKRFSEAVSLSNMGAAHPVRNGKELQQAVARLLSDSVHLRHASETARLFVESNTGATQRILDGIRSFGFVPAKLNQ